MVGANNAGKSTVVEALRLLSLVLTRYGALSFTEAPDWLRGTTSVRGMKPSLRYTDWNSESVFHNLGEPPAAITAKFDTGAKAEIYIGPSGAIHAVVTDASGRPVVNKTRVREVPLPKISALPQVAPVAQKEVILGSEHVERVTSSSWVSLHFRNQINLLPELFEEFKRLAEETWPSLRIMPLEGRGGLQKEPLGLLVQDGEFVAEVAWGGHGLQMWLHTMWVLAQSRKSEGIILDEPDVYLHADLQRQLIRLLRGRYRQLIIATHSVEIMAEVDATEVLIVDRRARRSVFASSIPAVQHVIDRLGGVHNLQLARLSSSGRCLLVEGGDVPLLKRIQNILSPHSQQPLDAVPNMPIGGWGGWSYAVGSRMLLKNAMGEEISVYCVFDSDYHTPEAIEARYNDADEKGVQLHIWERKELENYLIVGEAIRRLIATSTRAKAPPPVGEVNEVIEAILEQLKSRVFDSLSEEFLAQDRRGATAANHRARERVNEAWQTYEGRLSIVPGREVVSGLSDWSQSSYGVPISVAGILRELQRSEIDGEVAKLIRAIENGMTFEATGLRTGRRKDSNVS